MSKTERLTEQEILAQIEGARKRAALADAHEPRATGARSMTTSSSSPEQNTWTWGGRWSRVRTTTLNPATRSTVAIE